MKGAREREAGHARNGHKNLTRLSPEHMVLHLLVNFRIPTSYNSIAYGYRTHTTKTERIISYLEKGGWRTDYKKRQKNIVGTHLGECAAEGISERGTGHERRGKGHGRKGLENVPSAWQRERTRQWKERYCLLAERMERDNLSREDLFVLSGRWKRTKEFPVAQDSTGRYS